MGFMAKNRFDWVLGLGVEEGSFIHSLRKLELGTWKLELGRNCL